MVCSVDVQDNFKFRRIQVHYSCPNRRDWKGLRTLRLDNACTVAHFLRRWRKRHQRMDRQRTTARSFWTAFQTWIMSRNSLLNYVVYLMRFINQLGLLIWSIMILYAGYQYAWTIFKFWDPTKGKNAIKNAIIWILVIVFSYAIWKALESMFL